MLDKEEFEEFEDDETEAEAEAESSPLEEEKETQVEPKQIAKPIAKPMAKPIVKPIAKPIATAKPIETKEVEPAEEPAEVEEAQTPTQYVPVPRAVPIETMINELYDGQQEIKQALMAILDKIK